MYKNRNEKVSFVDRDTDFPAPVESYVVRVSDVKRFERRTGTGRFSRGNEVQNRIGTMKGWFDAFRIDGGPTLYSYSNRTPVTGDVPLVIVFVIFGTIFTAFLVIFPGVRKEASVHVLSRLTRPTASVY